MSTRTGKLLTQLVNIKDHMKDKLEDAIRRREEVDAEIADIKRVIRTAEMAERNLKEDVRA